MTKIISVENANTQNLQRDFIVIEYDSIPANVIFNKIHTEIASWFKSPKDNISTVGNNLISINGYVQEIVYNGEYPCDMEYTFVIEIKEGRVKYNYPLVNQLWMASPLGSKLRCNDTAFTNILNEYPSQNQRVAEYFNNIIQKLSAIINNDDKNDDW